MSFNLRAGQVNIDIFNPASSEHVPNWANQLRSWNVNGLRLGGGRLGISWQISPWTNPNWASELDRLLATIYSEPTADGGHFKAWFQCLDSMWGGALGLDDIGLGWRYNHPPRLVYLDWNQSSPPSTKGFPSYLSNWYYDPTPHCWYHDLQCTNPLGADTKYLIDKLADAYVSPSDPHHNFFTDPRIWVWSIANESTMGAPNGSGGIVTDSIYDWEMGFNDYVHQKGGKTMANCPIYGTGGDWLLDMALTVPFYEGKTDYFEIHDYGDMSYLYSNPKDWQGWQNTLLNRLNHQLQSSGSFGADRTVLGEWGLVHGTWSDFGGVTYMGDQDCVEWVTRYFAVLKQIGWKNLSYYGIYADAVEPPQYEMISVPDGTELAGSEVIKANYAGTAPPPVSLPFYDNFTTIDPKWVKINGNWNAI